MYVRTYILILTLSVLALAGAVSWGGGGGYALAQENSASDVVDEMTGEEIRRRLLETVLERLQVETRLVEERRKLQEATNALAKARREGSLFDGEGQAPPSEGTYFVDWQRDDRAVLVRQLPGSSPERLLVREGDKLGEQGVVRMDAGGGVIIVEPNGREAKLELYVRDARPPSAPEEENRGRRR